MAKTIFDDLNGKKLVIGLVHLLPMPATPLYEEGNIEKMMEKAIKDCKTLQNAGADGGLIQSVDVFYPTTDDTDYARVATISAIAARVRAEVGPDFKIGVQLMMNCITPSLAACKAAGVAVGAHPGFPDLMGFGRRNMVCSPKEAKAYIQYQMGALLAFTAANGVKLQHVKPHGALYNMAGKDMDRALAIAEAIASVDKDVILLGLAGSKMLEAGKLYNMFFTVRL